MDLDAHPCDVIYVHNRSILSENDRHYPDTDIIKSNGTEENTGNTT